MVYKIVIDCPAGQRRPNEVLMDVIHKTELQLEDFVEYSRVCGEWTWIVKEDKLELYMKHKNDIKSKLKHKYDYGEIRYAEV
jgi:hypothetical protein